MRRDDQLAELAAQSVNARVGDLSGITVVELSAAFGNIDAIVYSAGSNGGGREITKAIDGNGVDKAVQVARLVNVARFALVSVFPELWRERDLGAETLTELLNEPRISRQILELNSGPTSIPDAVKANIRRC